MSYEPKTWECGEVVTADALNHIEQGIESAQNGYECVTALNNFYEATLTFDNSEVLPYPTDSKPLSDIPADLPDSIVVTIDGTESVIEKNTFVNGNMTVEQYGGTNANFPYPTFGDDPCVMQRSNMGGGNWSQWYFYVAENGEHEIAIGVMEETIETTECFRKTVEWVSALKGSLTLGKGTADEVTITAAQLTALLALLNA